MAASLPFRGMFHGSLNNPHLRPLTALAGSGTKSFERAPHPSIPYLVKIQFWALSLSPWVQDIWPVCPPPSASLLMPKAKAPTDSQKVACFQCVFNEKAMLFTVIHSLSWLTVWIKCVGECNTIQGYEWMAYTDRHYTEVPFMYTRIKSLIPDGFQWLL